MTRHAPSPMDQAAVNHDTAADAGADRGIDEVPAALARTVLPLPKGCRDPVILEHDGQ